MLRNHVLALFTLSLALGSLAGCGTPAGTMQVASVDANVEAQRAYTIIDMEGIGPVYAAKLQAAGVSNTDKFLAATQDRAGRQTLAERAGIPYKDLLKWAQAANLMRLQGIGVKQANLLQAVGVASVKDLAQRNAANLADRLGVANHVGARFSGSTPSEATVAKWIEAAKQLAGSLDDQS